jgi:hypothetical protein
MAHLNMSGGGGVGTTPNIDRVKHGWFRFANFFNHEMQYKINKLYAIRKRF